MSSRRSAIARARQHHHHRTRRAGELIEIADTVTEMREIKHAYQQGIRAMRGIDY